MISGLSREVESIRPERISRKEEKIVEESKEL